MTRGPGRPLAVVAFLVASAQGAVAAAPDPGAWVGTWLSEDDGVTNVTTLLAGGRFRTEHLAGTRVLGVTSGGWELRDNAVRWSYDAGSKTAPSAEDVNAIVLKAPDRFVVREVNGSESRFFLKGVVDPKSPPDLPVAIGAGWVLKDALGEFVIRVTAREMVGDRDCYRVDWIQGDRAYQSEYWFLEADGIRVAGRRILGVKTEFSAPYLLVKRTWTRGDTWDASIAVRGKTIKLTLSVGQRGEVVTTAGTFQAVPVTMQGDTVSYVRWYAKDVGLVREDVLVDGAAHNTKILQRRLE